MNIRHHCVILLLLLSTHTFAQSSDIETDAVYLSGNTSKALIMAGCRNYENYPKNCHDHIDNLSNIKILDPYGGGNGKGIHSAEQRNYLVSDNYSQLSIGNANHQYDGNKK